jgi:hypothetical protein
MTLKELIEAIKELSDSRIENYPLVIRISSPDKTKFFYAKLKFADIEVLHEGSDKEGKINPYVFICIESTEPTFKTLEEKFK